MASDDAARVLSLARALGKWFNEPGLAQMALDLGSHAGFVGVRDAEMLGFITWTRVEPDTAELSWMGVSEERQRQGIGTTLLSALRAHLRQVGFRHLLVSTVADNVDYEPYVRTRRFYRAQGFADYRIDARYWGEGEDRYDRLVMRLDLTRDVRGNAAKGDEG